MLCDPSIRLLQYLNEALVMMEPTKQAVHEYVLTRIEKAQVLYFYLIFYIARVI